MPPHLLDHHLISETPAPMSMGELPRRYEEIPARVVVNLCGSYPRGEPFGRVVYGMALLDVVDVELLPERRLFEGFLATVHHWAQEEPSYWHCHAGLNRSGLAVAAYLHLFRGFRVSDAIQHLRSVRDPMVLCNPTFERALRSWYGEADEQVFEPVELERYQHLRRGSRASRLD